MLTFALLLFAAILLFWAIVLIFVLIGSGSELVKVAHSAVANEEPFSWGTFFSGVIAVSAVIVSAGSLFVTRRHQRLSVKPQLEIVLALDPNKSIGNRIYHSREICLRNYGLGPARITDYCFDFGADHGVAHDEAELRAILTSKLKFPGGLPKTYFLTLLPVERTERIFWIEPSHNPTEEYLVLLAFAALRSSLKLTVTYESMYCEVQQVTETFRENLS